MTALYEVDEFTLAARAAILEHAPELFPTLARTKEGRAELAKHRKIATERMASADRAEATWAVLMLWHIDRAMPAKPRARACSRPHVPRGSVVIERSELELIAYMAEVGADALRLPMDNLPETNVSLRGDLREAAARFRRIAKRCRANGARS